MTQNACLLRTRSTFCVGEAQFLSLLFIYLCIFGHRGVENHVFFLKKKMWIHAFSLCLDYYYVEAMWIGMKYLGLSWKQSLEILVIRLK